MMCVVFGSGLKGNLTYFRKQFAGKKNITIFVCRLKSSVKNHKSINLMADIKQYVKAAEEKMTFAIDYLDEQLSHIRAGKANPKILDCVRVMYYGAPVPLTNVATVTVPDARTIMITPWEKKIIRDIEKGILDSEVGITPENNGEVIRLGIPPLTEERRRQLAKQSKQEAETAKISIRNARRDAIEQLKKSIKTDGTPEDVEKDAEAEVQKVHDKYIKKVDELYAAKEKEIMTV